MIPASFTLAVDTANTGSTTDKTFTRFRYVGDNKSVYVSDAHTVAERDEIALTRKLPTRTGNFEGVAKSALKYTRDVDVEGVDTNTTEKSSGIIELSASLPVNMTSADITEMFMTACAFALQNALREGLFEKQSIG